MHTHCFYVVTSSFDYYCSRFETWYPASNINTDRKERSQRSKLGNFQCIRWLRRINQCMCIFKPLESRSRHNLKPFINRPYGVSVNWVTTGSWIFLRAQALWTISLVSASILFMTIRRLTMNLVFRPHRFSSTRPCWQLLRRPSSLWLTRGSPPFSLEAQAQVDP